MESHENMVDRWRGVEGDDYGAHPLLHVATVKGGGDSDSYFLSTFCTPIQLHHQHCSFLKTWLY